MTNSRLIFIASGLIFFALSAFLYRAVPTQMSCFDIDSFGYDKVAHHFFKTGTLTDPENPGKALVQPVGYHFFVGIMYKLFGYRYWPIILLQVLLMFLSCFLTFLIARHFFSESIALLSLFLCAINIGFLVYPQFLLAEAVVVPMVLIFIERFLSFIRSGRLVLLAQSGLVGGLSVLVKPTALFFFFVIILFLLLQRNSNKHRLSAAFLFALSCCVPIMGYLVYNKVRYDYFKLAPMTSLNLYSVFLSKVIARVHNIPIDQAERRIPPFNSSNPLDERGWDGARKLFWHYVISYPGTCCIVWGQNVSKTVFGLFTTQLKVLLSESVHGGDVSFFANQGSIFSRAYLYIIQGSSSWFVSMLAFFEAFWTVLRYLLVLIAIVGLMFAKRYATVLFFLAYFVCFSFVTGFDGCCRYRILFEPLLIILTSVSLVALYDWMFSSTKKIGTKIWWSRHCKGMWP